MAYPMKKLFRRISCVLFAMVLLLQMLPVLSLQTNAAETKRTVLGDLDTADLCSAYTCTSKENWIPMYPAGQPDQGTWPAWDDTHYGELVKAGYQDVGALHLKSSPGANTGIAINAGMQSGRRYTLSFWAKGSSNAGRVLAMYGNGDAILIGDASELSDQWKKYQVTFTATMSQLNLVVADWGNTDIYIDNISLKYYFTEYLSGCGDFCKEVTATDTYEPAKLNLLRVASAYNCQYPDCWMPMYPAGQPDQGTWPAWDGIHYAEIVEDGYGNSGALHMVSAVQKNTAVAIGANMTVGQTYTLGMWFKGSTNNSNKVLTLYGNGDHVIVGNPKYSPNGQSGSTTISQDWTYAEISFTATMSQLNLLCADWGNNDIWIDNLTLKDSSGKDILYGYGNFRQAISPAVEDANLDFEYSSVDIPMNWTHKGVLADSTMELYTQNVYSGNQALRIHRQKGQLDCSFVYSQSYIPVSYGDKLEFVANIASRNSISGDFSMFVLCYGENVNADYEDYAYGQTRITNAGENWSQWDTYSLRYTVPEGIRYVQLALRIGGAQADVLVDDIAYFNYSDNGYTIYQEDFAEPAITTGLPGGWVGKATEGKLNSGDSISTKLYTLQTGCTYNLNAQMKTNHKALVTLEAVDYRGVVTQKVATMQIDATSVATETMTFCAVSATYYRLTVQAVDGIVELGSLSVQKIANAEKKTNDVVAGIGEKWTIDGEMTTSSVESVNGKTYLLVNGEVQVPMWYAPPENPILYESHTVTEFAKAGIDTVVAYVFLNNYYGDIWTEDGFVSDGIDSMMESILQGNPNAKILMALDFSAPQWWCEQNPGELAALANSTPDKTNASFASEKWKQESTAIMSEAISYMMAQPYGNQIIGFKVTGGYTLEWNWWASSGTVDDVGDFSQCGILAFRQWLKEKYGTDKALQTAYGNTSITLSNAMPPSADQRRDDVLDTVITVQTHPEMMDYEQYMAQLKADTIAYFAKFAKDAVDGRLIVGTYGGYFHAGGGYEFSSAVANAYFQQLLQSEYIDFIQSPWMYGMREIGDSAEFMGPVDSLDLYGKLWIVEDDTRMNLQAMTGKQDDNAGVGQTRDYAQSVAQIKRNVSLALSKGVGVSFYDLVWNFYDDAQYYGVIAQLYAEAKTALCMPCESTAEIAVFVDGESHMLIPYDGDVTNSVLHTSVFREQLEELGHIGASYDVYLLDDLKDGLVPEHKINIFLGTTMVTEAERQAIESRLQKNGNILVWIFTDGISNGNMTDITLMESLIGMDLGIIGTERKHTATLQITDNTHWLTSGMQSGQYYGVENYDKLSPVIAVQDSSATVLGYHSDLNKQVALAVKDMGTWTSIYSAIPNLPQILFRNMLQKVGGHIYTDSGSDVIHANSDYVALHSIFAGERQIRLPEKYTVYDVFTGEIVDKDVDAFTVTLDGKDTKLFRLTQATESYLTIDATAMTGAYDAPQDCWTPMYPTGTPGGTWPAWSKSTHYGEVVAEGYRDPGALHLKSDQYKNVSVALNVSMTPGQKYTLGLWAKGTSNSGRVLALYANGDPLIIGSSDKLTADWSYYEITFTANIQQINLMASDWGVTDVYVDHITLKNSAGVDLLAGYGDFYAVQESITHNWLEGDCLTPKTCFVCGITDGDASGHSYEETVTKPTLSAGGYCTYTCTVCGDSYTDDYTAPLTNVESWNLVLGDNLQVNFKLNLDDSIADTAHIVLVVAGVSDTYPASDVYHAEDGGYYVSVKLAAAQMNEIIYLMVANGNETSPVKQYTVEQYAKTLLSDSEYASYHPLLKSMLHYGAMAQTYFDYHADRPVNQGIEDVVMADIPETAPQEPEISGEGENIAFYGASLVFRDRIAVRYYFTLTDEMENHSFVANGTRYTPVLKDGYCYVEVPGINPQDLDENIRVIVDGNLEVTYHPLNYVVRMNQKGPENLKALLKALYHYHLTAEVLFD